MRQALTVNYALFTWGEHPFDSVFHRDLRMPPATTCGTMGYAPPFVWQNGRTDPASTWRLGADRFALTILNVEFLTLCTGAPLAGEDGLFDQGELGHGSGEGIDWARDVLRRDYPPLEDLFERVLTAYSFEDCPTAADWLSRLDQFRGRGSKAPSLADLPQLPAADFEDLLARRRPAAPIWPAPRLDELKEAFSVVLPVAAFRPTLPHDPWSRV